jgi:ribosomal protein S18 acetylase RimI-like enzyme
MKLAYRSALPADAAACVALRGRTRENAVSEERLRSLGITVQGWGEDIRRGALPGFVALEDGGRMLGYCFGDRASGEVVVLALLPEAEGRGILLYMNQEGRGIGLLNKLKAYKLQEEGLDTVEANVALGFKPDHRDYGVGAQILRHLGVEKMRLLTNNPTKRVGLTGYGLEIVERVALEVGHLPENARYMRTKRDKMGHELGLLGMLKH